MRFYKPLISIKISKNAAKKILIFYLVTTVNAISAHIFSLFGCNFTFFDFSIHIGHQIQTTSRSSLSFFIIRIEVSWAFYRSTIFSSVESCTQTLKTNVRLNSKKFEKIVSKIRTSKIWSWSFFGRKIRRKTFENVKVKTEINGSENSALRKFEVRKSRLRKVIHPKIKGSE